MNRLYKPLLCVLVLSSVVLVALPVTARTDESKPISQSASKDNVSSLENDGYPERQNISGPRLSALRVALLFRSIQKTPKYEPAAATVDTVEQKQTQTATWLKKLGIIRDGNGAMRLYFKDTRTGSLIRVRTDGTQENGYRLTITADGNNAIETPEGLFLLTGEK